MREKDQADYDLERVIELFDTALTSKDERVVNSLRNLLMITALTLPESHNQSIHGSRGPLSRMQEEMRDLSRTVNDMRHKVNHLTNMFNPSYMRDLAKDMEIEKAKASIYTGGYNGNGIGLNLSSIGAIVNGGNITGTP
jgi:uncharacterized protein YlxW (UPF0749 family)